MRAAINKADILFLYVIYSLVTNNCNLGAVSKGCVICWQTLPVRLMMQVCEAYSDCLSAHQSTGSTTCLEVFTTRNLYGLWKLHL